MRRVLQFGAQIFVGKKVMKQAQHKLVPLHYAQHQVPARSNRRHRRGTRGYTSFPPSYRVITDLAS